MIFLPFILWLEITGYLWKKAKMFWYQIQTFHNIKSLIQRPRWIGVISLWIKRFSNSPNRWSVCARTPRLRWRTAHRTFWTCCLTPTSTCAPYCHATRARWRCSGRMSISVWWLRTWPTRSSRPSACSRKLRRGCTRKTLSQGRSASALQDLSTHTIESLSRDFYHTVYFVFLRGVW